MVAKTLMNYDKYVETINFDLSLWTQIFGLD